MSHRTSTYTYNVTQPVCRKAFMSVHGILQHKLEWVLGKAKEAATGTPVPYKRGEKPSPMAIVGEILQHVHDDIATLPVITSHYSRAHTPHRQYLETGSKMREFYVAYLDWMLENHPEASKVSSRFYRKVFTEEYNIVSQPFVLPAKPTTSQSPTCARPGRTTPRWWRHLRSTKSWRLRPKGDVLGLCLTSR